MKNYIIHQTSNIRHHIMVHFGKKQDDELQIIVTGQDIEALRRMIVSSSLMERRTFYGLKEYIETEYKDIITKQQAI